MLINNHSITLQPTLVPKVLKSTCRPLRLLSACKKSTSFLTSFLRYCTDIINLLFWKLWKCLTISIKIIVSACSKLSCLPACKNSISSFTFFLRYCREIANVSGHTHQKWHFHSEEAFDNYQQGKINSSFTLSLRYCKDIIKLLFWVLWACLAMHTQSDTINLQNIFVFICR